MESLPEPRERRVITVWTSGRLSTWQVIALGILAGLVFIVLAIVLFWVAVAVAVLILVLWLRAVVLRRKR